MQYDIFGKQLLKWSKEAFLEYFLDIQAESIELLEELPQETISSRSSDYPLLVKSHGQTKIVLLELQTKWQADKPPAMAEYYLRFLRQFPDYDIEPVMMLLTKSGFAGKKYKHKYLTFQFQLFKLWQENARKFLQWSKAHGRLELYPLVPLMHGGESYIWQIEKELYDSTYRRQKKADLLNALAVFGAWKIKQYDHNF